MLSRIYKRGKRAGHAARNVGVANLHLSNRHVTTALGYSDEALMQGELYSTDSIHLWCVAKVIDTKAHWSFNALAAIASILLVCIQL